MTRSSGIETSTGRIRGDDAPSPLHPLALRAILLVAAIGSIPLLLTLTRYGYHRDELYFLACGKRLAFGYVDQPPLVPAIAALSNAIAPGSLAVLRLWPAAMAAGTVVMAGVIGRELGAGRAGQIAVAVVAAAMPGTLFAGHLLSTATLDFLVWAVVSWLVLRLLRTGATRWWIAIGVAVGVGLENKWTVAFLVAGLLLGILATRQRRLLWSPWFVAGIAIALAIWAPNLWWQAQHDWPQLDMIRTIGARSNGLGYTLMWIPVQVYLSGAGVVVWIAGLVRILRNPDARAFRALGIAYLVLAVVLAVAAGDKPYYVAGLYVPLMGAGAVPLERWLGRHRRGWARPVAVAALLLVTLVSLPLVLPVLPVKTFADLGLNDASGGELGEEVGWTELVDQVAAAWRSLPPDRRAHAIIVTANYGEAGAIERFGPDLGLPVPYSGHNSYWWWATPPSDATTVVLVGMDAYETPTSFASAHPAGTIDNPAGLENQELGAPIWIASRPRTSLSGSWPLWRHYD